MSQRGERCLMKKSKNDKKGNPVGIAAITGLVSGTARAIFDYILENFLD
jgi:hypothetical protein